MHRFKRAAADDNTCLFFVSFSDVIRNYELRQLAAILVPHPNALSMSYSRVSYFAEARPSPEMCGMLRRRHGGCGVTSAIRNLHSARTLPSSYSGNVVTQGTGPIADGQAHALSMGSSPRSRGGTAVDGPRSDIEVCLHLALAPTKEAVDAPILTNHRAGCLTK